MFAAFQRKNISNNIFLFFIFAVGCSLLLWLVFNFQLLSSNIYSELNYNNIVINPYLDFSKGIIFSVFFSLIFLKNKTLLLLWFFKVFVTLFLFIPFEFYYGLDSFTYFHWAVNFDLDPIKQYWGDSGSTTKLIIFTHYLTYFFGDSYYSIKVFFSLLAFFGLILFHKAYCYILYSNSSIGQSSDKFIYLLFLFPSIIFWSSGIGKDSINLLFTGIFIYSFIRLSDKVSIKYLIYFALSLFVMFHLRFWWVFIMTMSIMLYYATYPSLKSSFLLVLLIPVLYFLALNILEMRGLSLFSDIFNEMSSISREMSDFGNSSIKPVEIGGIFDYMLLYIPNSFTAIFRPMIWEARNPFSLISSIENTVLLFFSIKFIVFKFTQVVKNKHIVYLLIFIFSWTIPYSIISSGNLGAAVRFKLQILPIILIIIGIVHHKLKK